MDLPSEETEVVETEKWERINLMNLVIESIVEYRQKNTSCEIKDFNSQRTR
jgi:hypothetical protein